MIFFHAPHGLQVTPRESLGVSVCILEPQPEHLAEPEWYFYPAPYICVNAIIVELGRCRDLSWIAVGDKHTRNGCAQGRNVGVTDNSDVTSFPYNGKG